jgi:hypothetical protein
MRILSMRSSERSESEERGYAFVTVDMGKTARQIIWVYGMRLEKRITGRQDSG